MMNSLADQNLEGQTMMCQIHDNKIIAVNTDSSITGVVTHLCYKCLVDKTNNNKILTIVKAKEQIASYKKQKQKKKKNEIEIILTQLQNLFQNIQQFKCKVDTVLEKISNELSKQTKLKQQELLISENCLNQHNFWEDVQILSEFVSKQEEQIEIQYMNEMQIQFQQISVDIDYLQTIEAFENAIKIITKFNIENQIQLEGPQIENNIKTISLSTLCQDHNKEVILIDIDSENIQPEKRLACAQCVRNLTSQKYQTIEEINDLWNKKRQKVQQDTIANQQKSKKQIKQKKLNEQIASISRHYYQQLNLITQAKFFQPNTQTGETSKFKQTSIQQLSYEELLSNINDLDQQDKITVNLDEHMITKDIETKLEKIKQDFQLDIQKSINYLNDQSSDSQLLEIKEQIQKIQARSILQQEEQIRIQELDELIISSKQLYCQMELLNQTKNQFQEHMKKLNTIKKQIAVFSNHQDVTNINQALDEYVYKFEKNFQNLKKYCGMDELIESFQSEIKQLENSNKSQIEKKDALIKNFEQKFFFLNLYLMQFIQYIYNILLKPTLNLLGRFITSFNVEQIFQCLKPFFFKSKCIKTIHTLQLHINVSIALINLFLLFQSSAVLVTYNLISSKSPIVALFQQLSQI